MRDERNEAAGQKLDDEQLDEVAGGFACPSADVPLYDWTKFDIAIARGVSNVPGGCLTISYEPDRPCNSGVGGWGEGE